MDKERGNTFVKEKPLYSERTREKMFCDDDIFFAIDMYIYTADIMRETFWSIKSFRLEWMNELIDEWVKALHIFKNLSAPNELLRI